MPEVEPVTTATLSFSMIHPIENGAPSARAREANMGSVLLRCNKIVRAVPQVASQRSQVCLDARQGNLYSQGKLDDRQVPMTIKSRIDKVAARLRGGPRTV